MAVRNNDDWYDASSSYVSMHAEAATVGSSLFFFFFRAPGFLWASGRWAQRSLRLDGMHENNQERRFTKIWELKLYLISIIMN